MTRIAAGDVEQRARLGAGGALAQVWGHPIAPLLSPADRRTQILWGLQDFRHRFGRAAEGIWLPETAVDAATLEALIEAGVRFTIVAPEQIAAVRAPGETWTEVNRDTIDSGRPYRWVAADGRSITLAVFDGPLSREIAFGTAARDAATFLHQVKRSAERSGVIGHRLVLAASDGELYGHHKKFADLTLAYATAVDATANDIEVTNLAAFLNERPATWEAELAKGPHGEGTAWSCPHGLGRWRRHCGCAMRPQGETGWTQAWRGPLRDGLDLLRDRAAAFFDDLGGDLFLDPWGARDAFGEVVDEAAPTRARFLRDFGRPTLAGGEREAERRALALLEMQRSALLMYASCGWFFDDIAGLESALVLRQAAHVVDLWQGLGGAPPLPDVLDVLAKGHSNEPTMGTGADVFRRVARERVTARIAVARAAFVALGAPPPEEATPGFAVALPADAAPHALTGTADVTHRRSGETTRVAFTAAAEGPGRFVCVADGERIELEDLDLATARPLRMAAIERLAATPTLAGSREALTLASKLGPLAPAEAERLQALMARLLLGLLEAHTPNLAEPVLAAVAELVEAANLPARSEQSAHLAEDLIWDTMATFQERHEALPPTLQRLAERLRLAPAKPKPVAEERPRGEAAQ
jgi:hypothetical protein